MNAAKIEATTILTPGAGHIGNTFRPLRETHPGACLLPRRPRTATHHDTGVRDPTLLLLLLLGGGAFWYYQRSNETPTAASKATEGSHAPKNQIVRRRN
jgi:hypothetical protein